jgi:ATP/maltotriose-dependent transcriptional regulator MalT
MLDVSKWSTINEIALLVHGTEDIHQMQRFFLEALRNVVPFDRALFFLIEETENNQFICKSPVCISLNDDFMQHYESLINSNSIFRRVLSLRRTLAYRSSDLVTPDEDTTDFVAEARKQFLFPNNVAYYSGIVVTNERGEVLGEIVLYRTEKQKDFTSDDVAVLDVLKDHLAIRLRLDRKESQKLSPSREDFSLSALGLTPRESEITSLLLQHYSTEGISKKLVISQYTTKKHLQNIFAKLGVRNRLQLVDYVHDWEKHHS